MCSHCLKTPRIMRSGIDVFSRTFLLKLQSSTGRYLAKGLACLSCHLTACAALGQPSSNSTEAA